MRQLRPPVQQPLLMLRQHRMRHAFFVVKFGFASFCSTLVISDWIFSISFVSRIFSAAGSM